MENVSRRGIILGGAAGFALGAPLVTPAEAQTSADSTWETIRRTKKLRVGAAQLEPWYFKDISNSDAPGVVKTDSGSWRGIGPLIGQELAAALDVQLEIVETTWAGAVAGLQANQFDIVFNLDGTPQRALAIDFVPAPLLWTAVTLLLRDGVVVETWEDANVPERKWGAILGTSMDQFLTRAAPNADIQRFPNNSDYVAAFQSGRVDGIVGSSSVNNLIAARTKMGTVAIPKPIAALAQGVGIRQEPDARWRNFLNTAISYYYNTGRTQELYNTFLTFRGLDLKDAVPVIREQWH